VDYTDYKNSRDMAWRILLDCRVKELPVSVTEICRMLGIQIKLYKPQDDNDGMSLILNEVPMILVGSNSSGGRQRFTAAHEMGHILLGHVGKYELVSREPSPSDSPIEQAANVFASRLLAPACVLWGCRAATPEEIMRLCKISHPAAQFRAERLTLLIKRGMFLASPLERAVYAQFRDFMEAYRSVASGN
jgi:Zn-dependent peptidase ImmA (M78 family)